MGSIELSHTGCMSNLWRAAQACGFTHGKRAIPSSAKIAINGLLHGHSLPQKVGHVLALNLIDHL
jgi:hypothetical protein